MADPFALAATGIALGQTALALIWGIRSRARRLLPPESSTLSVLDLETNNNNNNNGLASLNLTLAFRSNDTIPQIPPMANGAKVRFYVCDNFSNFSRYFGHFPALRLDGLATGRGFDALYLQWCSSTPKNWWESSSFSIWRPIGGLLERFQKVGGAILFAESLLEPVKGVLVLENGEGGATVFVSCQAFQAAQLTENTRPSDQHVLDSTYHNYIRTLQQLTGKYSQLLSDTSSSTRLKKTLLLWHCHSQVLEWSKFLNATASGYTSFRQRLFDSRSSVLRPHLLDELSMDAYIYQELVSTVSQITIPIESLVNAVGTSYTNVRNTDGNADARTHVEELATDIRGLCTGIKTEASKLVNDLEHHLTFMELRRGVRESNNLWTLTVLASVFLPLSLASSILSMGTRFVDLGQLLYDFCGVTVLLATLAFTILLLVRITVWASEKFEDADFSNIIRKTVSAILQLSLFATWAVVLSSFIVGMVSDVALGGKILGFGTVGLAGAGLIGFFILGLPFITLGRKLFAFLV